MAYYNQYWDAYYRSEGDSIDTGVSHFNSGGYTASDSDVFITGEQLPGVTSTLTPEKFSGVASASFSEFSGGEHSATPTKKAQNVSVTDESSDVPDEEISYSVKVIRSHTGTSVETLTMKKFESVDEIRSKLQSEFFGDEPFNFGYIKRGHGMNGKQIQIESDSDLIDMYVDYRGSRKHVNMWAKSMPARKRSRSEMEDPQKCNEEGTSTKKKKSSGNYRSHLTKMSEVELILDELEGRHENSKKFTAEQLRVWAHLLHMKKHDSYEHPPNKPFFCRSKGIQKLAGVISTESGMSPTKKIHLRTELIEQLGKWHSLMERGAISQEQFQSMKETIIIDMKNY